jgi:hypothetical protein
MNDETTVLRDVKHILSLKLPAAIRLEMIGHRLDWHEAHQAQDWDAAQVHFNALAELQSIYDAQPVSTR